MGGPMSMAGLLARVGRIDRRTFEYARGSAPSYTLVTFGS
jgi:hypothetical protein